MLEPHLSNPRKRQRPEQHSPQLNRISQPPLKRGKLDHPQSEVRSRTPAAFYDNLSKVWLTKGALRELDRRNAQSAPRSPCSSRWGSHRPFTRHALAESEGKNRLIQSASDFLCHCTSKCLGDIKRFAKHGGPDLLDLRGVCIAKSLPASELIMSLQYPQPINPFDHAMSSIQSSSRGRGRKRSLVSSSKPQTPATIPTTTTATTTAYHRNFQQNLIDHGVYPEEYEYPDGRIPPAPNNWEEINQRLIQRRPSLSPSQFSDGAFRKFKRANAHASKEIKVTDSVIPIIQGEINDGKCVVGDIPFTNLDHLTDGALSSGKPDLFYGARPEQLNRRIRNELKGHIVPSTQEDLPIAPNFFLAAKGPDGTAAVAGRQACYHGALGARGIQSLQSYGQPEPVYDNNAYTITSIYSDGQLKIYGSHPAQPTNPKNRPEYSMNQLGAFAMTNNPETFRQGATAYRNARDWAKERRDEFIEAANTRMPVISTESPSLESSGYGEASISPAGPILAETDTSADELALEVEQNSTSIGKRRKMGPPESNRRLSGRRYSE
ncbi:MAG: hypothetical protein Q9187_005522 [Circinaria calcarea]